jgi:hypothetical protein
MSVYSRNIDYTLLFTVCNISVSWLYTYFLHGAESFLRKTGSQLVKKLPEFYGNRKFITAFTSARHLSLLIQLNWNPRSKFICALNVCENISHEVTG